MLAKYEGSCSRCGLKILRGEQITWNRSRRGRVYHTDCTQAWALNNHQESNGSAPAPIYEPEMETNKDSKQDSLAELLAQAISGHLHLPEAEAKLDEKAVQAIIAKDRKSFEDSILSIISEELKKIQAITTIEIKNPETNETKDIGVQHKQFPNLLKVLSTRLNCWLAGPSGSGKTQAAMNCAEALGIKFYFCGAQNNEYGMSGYIDAQGKTVRTLFREAYENGGIFLFDEVDASSPSALLWLNAALSNVHCAFPDAVVKRHPDFCCIAAANTWGLGGTNDYVGRFKMDAAFLKRFVFIAWEYDEALETAISGNATWAKRVQDLRAKAKAKGIKVIISPRETISGAKLLAAGMDQSDVEDMTALAGMTEEQKAGIR